MSLSWWRQLVQRPPTTASRRKCGRSSFEDVFHRPATDADLAFWSGFLK